MKKTIAILLVAILAVSSVFAAFSGKASVGFGGNLDNGNFGFIDQSTNAKIDLELATANAENVGEGDIFASIKASLVVRLFNGEKGTADDDPLALTPFYMPLTISLDEAKVGGENWYVSILGMPDGPDYAKSAIDTYDVKKKVDDYGFTKADYTGNYSFSVPYADTNGIEVGLFGYKFGFGLLGDYNEGNNWKLEDNLNFAVFAETPAYDFGGLTVQAAATYSYKSFDRFGDTVNRPVNVLVDPETGKTTSFSKTNAIGLAAKVGFANDTLSASIATDMGFNLEGDKFEDVFDMDIAANFGWSFLTLDAYYATTAKSGEGKVGSVEWDANLNGVGKGGYKWNGDKWGSKYTDDVLSFQAKFDLNTFDVPVAITASVKDVLKTVELGVKAEVTPVEGLKVTASAGYVIDTINAYSKADWMRNNAAKIVKTMNPEVTADEVAYYEAMIAASSDKDINKQFKDNMKDVFLGQWKVGLDAEYDFGFAKVAAGLNVKNAGLAAFFGDKAFDKRVADDATEEGNNGGIKNEADLANFYANQVVLGASASISTESIIPGAELKLAWENGDDLLKVFKYDSAAEVYNYGKITASCTIEF